MKYDSFKFSYIGGRSYNEDYAGIKQSESDALYIVADGLGGYQHSEMASECVVNTMEEAFPPEDFSEADKWLENILEKANSEVMSLQEENRTSIRSTVVALLINGDKANWAHIGDSRLYYVHNCSIKCVTEDHSVAFKKYKAGEITYDEIPRDEDQSRLLRAIGSERNKPEFGECSLDKADGFMLCSDGMWEYIKDEEILVDYIKSHSARHWGEYMLMRVMERLPDNSDNLTLITVMIS